MGSDKLKVFLFHNNLRFSAPPLAGRGFFLPVPELGELLVYALALGGEDLYGLQAEGFSLLNCGHVVSFGCVAGKRVNYFLQTENTSSGKAPLFVSRRGIRFDLGNDLNVSEFHCKPLHPIQRTPSDLNRSYLNTQSEKNVARSVVECSEYPIHFPLNILYRRCTRPTSDTATGTIRGGLRVG
jgi:hypothetical protein